jgi:uncharacterized damage-inducible protein DinB
MNRDVLNDLYDYTSFTWQTYARAMRSVSQEDLNRGIEGSGWSALRQPLVHVACAWDGYLAEHAGDTFTDFDLDAITTWEAIEGIRATTRAWMRRILDEMPDADLFEKTEPASDHPEANRVTCADALLHIFLHERGHHGDISTVFSQLGVPLAGNDYLVYRFFKDRKG